jgi:hypothetical protein
MDFLADLARDYAALLVSICALFLTINQSLATRKHNRLTVRPHLTSFVDHRPDPERQGITTIKVTLSNNGLGPAIIQKFELLLDGVPIEHSEPGDLFPTVEKVLPVRLLSDECHFAVLRQNYVMGKDTTLPVATVSYVPTIHDDPAALRTALKRFHIRVAYESGYGESFVYDSRNHQTPV